MTGALLVLDAQLADGQTTNLEVADFERADPGAPDREAADRKRADRDGTCGEGADGNGAGRSAAERTGGARPEQLGTSLSMADLARTAGQAHGLAAIVAGAAPAAGRVECALTARAGAATIPGAASRWFSNSERPTYSSMWRRWVCSVSIVCPPT